MPPEPRSEHSAGGALRFQPPRAQGKVRHDPRLDGVRGFAAATVMMGHTSWLFLLGNNPPAYVPSAYFLNLHLSRGAVFLFFIISGYVIGLTNTGPCTAPARREYLRRRLLRIFPIYLLAIAAGWLAFTGASAGTVAGNLLFLQNDAWPMHPLPGNTPLWSLHYEAVYYLGFLAVWSFRPRAVPLGLVLLALALLDWFVGGTLSFLGGWAVGAIFWLAGLLIAWSRDLRPARPCSWTFSLVLLAYATSQFWPGKVLLNGLGFPYAGQSAIWLSDLALLPVSVALVCSVLAIDLPYLKVLRLAALALPLGTLAGLLAVRRVTENVPWSLSAAATLAAVLALPFDQGSLGARFFTLFRPVGKVSYGLYVFHIPCAILLSRWYPWSPGVLNFAGAYLAWWGLSLTAAWVAEFPFQRLVVSWFRRRGERVRPARLKTS